MSLQRIVYGLSDWLQRRNDCSSNGICVSYVYIRLLARTIDPNIDLRYTDSIGIRRIGGNWSGYRGWWKITRRPWNLLTDHRSKMTQAFAFTRHTGTWIDLWNPPLYKSHYQTDVFLGSLLHGRFLPQYLCGLGRAPTGCLSVLLAPWSPSPGSLQNGWLINSGSSLNCITLHRIHEPIASKEYLPSPDRMSDRSRNKLCDVRGGIFLLKWHR